MDYFTDFILSDLREDMDDMKTSNFIKDKIKEFEGLRLEQYTCAGGKCTIGYGHVCSPSLKKISQAEANELFEQDILRFENHVNDYNIIYSFSQEEFDALVSFAFNIGNINQLTNYGKRDKATIAVKILQYVNAGGKPLEGLRKRRQFEHDLFVGSITQTTTKTTGVLYPHVKATYRLRTEPTLAEETKLETAMFDIICTILAKCGDFYQVRLRRMGNYDNVWVHIKGIIWK